MVALWLEEPDRLAAAPLQQQEQCQLPPRKDFLAAWATPHRQRAAAAVLARRGTITPALVLPGLAVQGFCHHSADHCRATAAAAVVGILAGLAQAGAEPVEEQPVVKAQWVAAARQTQAAAVVAVTPVTLLAALADRASSSSDGTHRRQSPRSLLA